MPFIAKNKVRMHDTDMAGILYFARQFRFVHDTLEECWEAEGFDFQKVFHEDKNIFVIVHCEADYYTALHVGDKLEVHLSCQRIGDHSFTLFYQIFKVGKENVLAGTARTVHVCLDSGTREKVPVPKKFRTLLEKYQVS